MRWLSVIREEDFYSVQSHRLVVSDVEKVIGELNGNDYAYPEDSDESATEVLWDFSDYQMPQDSNRKSLSLEFGRQARDAT